MLLKLVVFELRSISLIRFEFLLLFSIITFSYPLRMALNEDVVVVTVGIEELELVVSGWVLTSSFTSITVTKWLGCANKSDFLRSLSTATELSLTLSIVSIVLLCSVFITSLLSLLFDSTTICWLLLSFSCFCLSLNVFGASL